VSSRTSFSRLPSRRRVYLTLFFFFRARKFVLRHRNRVFFSLYFFCFPRVFFASYSVNCPFGSLDTMITGLFFLYTLTLLRPFFSAPTQTSIQPLPSAFCEFCLPLLRVCLNAVGFLIRTTRSVEPSLVTPCLHVIAPPPHVSSFSFPFEFFQSCFYL